MPQKPSLDPMQSFQVRLSDKGGWAYHIVLTQGPFEYIVPYSVEVKTVETFLQDPDKTGELGRRIEVFLSPASERFVRFRVSDTIAIVLPADEVLPQLRSISMAVELDRNRHSPK